MIISITLKNFFSLRDEVTLDFIANFSRNFKSDYLPDNLIGPNNGELLNIIGIFGSNAAGKSNIIKAIDFCRNLILTSHLHEDGINFDYQTFKFDADKTSEFRINFLIDDIEYEYSFSICDAKVVTENLYFYPKKYRQTIFCRDAQGNYKYNKNLISRPKEVESNTGEGTLYLTRGAFMNRPLLQTVYSFFKEKMVVGLGPVDIPEATERHLEKNREMILNALEASDSDIIDLRITELQPGRKVLQSFHREMPGVAFDFMQEESEGTKRLLLILLVLLDKISADATIFLDEFDLKLHLRLAEFLLDMVRASGSGQLVFTSHNSNLIDITKLRPEQIVFVTKDAVGSSEFAPLSDYKGINPNMDIQKAYLQGRFDAVPYTASATSLFPQK